MTSRLTDYEVPVRHSSFLYHSQDPGTFDAVTHALAKTQLPGDDGKKYGSAVYLVEEVAGERKGAGGDEQFRLYVLMKRDAYSVSSKVKQFTRPRWSP